MCWNKTVSLITYIIVMVLVIILYRRNRGADRHLAIFSAVFVTIQLLEFFAWLSIEKRKQHNGGRKLNDLVTRLILIALWAQPLVNAYLAWRDRSTNSADDYCNDKSTDTGVDTDPLFNGAVRSVLLILVVVFVVLFMVAIKNATEKGSKFATYPGEHCHLVWSRKTAQGKFASSGNGFMANHSYQSLLYIAGLFLPILLIKPIKKGIILAILGAVLLLISRMMSSKKEVDSWWCWIAGLFVVAALILKDPKNSTSKVEIGESSNRSDDIGKKMKS